ncbi:hypothetical protein CBM2625_B110021 [Cupriavidus taiwanensis]|nr:hypothetical protein CBM2625_B110021 [Cupriavidus taiwanensis]
MQSRPARRHAPLAGCNVLKPGKPDGMTLAAFVPFPRNMTRRRRPWHWKTRLLRRHPRPAHCNRSLPRCTSTASPTSCCWPRG